MTSIGRVAMAVYVVVAAATTVWLMRDLRMELIATALAIGAPVAASASAYARRLLVAH